MLSTALTPSSASGQYVKDKAIQRSSPDTDERFGGAVANVKSDTLIVGAQDADGPSKSRAGRAYIVDAGDGTVLTSLNTNNETTQGNFGAAVGVVEDVTGDGFPDVIVGAPNENPDAAPTPNAGVAYVFDGKNGGFVETLQTTVGNIEDGRRFGASASGIEDVNGDNTPDIVVGAPGQTDGNGGAGHAYVFSGANLGGDPIAVLTGAGESGGNFGESLAPVGDLVGDGTSDFVVGAPGEVGGDGQIYLVDGGTIGGTVSTTTVTSPNKGGAFGAAVDSFGTAGDRDIVVGAPREGGGGTSDGGRAYILDGANPGTSPISINSPNAEGSGSAPSSGDFGASVSGVQDVNGDGFSEVLVGAPGETINGGNDREGRAYIFDGATGTLVDELTSPNVTNQGEFGIAVAGLPRPVVGAHQEDGNSVTQAGRVYTFRIPQIAFVDGRGGEAYDPPGASDGESDVPVGRFKLNTDDSRSRLESVVVSNEGTSVSGIDQIELWSSSNNTFESGSDTPIASKSYSGSPVSFSGLSTAISTGGTYFFVVLDLGNSTSGEYDPAIQDETNIGLKNGQIVSVNGNSQRTFEVASGEGFLSTGPTSPLPVELTTLEAAVTGSDAVTLRWGTASETNNAGFAVERRAGGVAEQGAAESWTEVGFVESKAEGGTTGQPLSYRFTDDDLPYAAEILTYRLRQVDTDGTVSLSAPVTVERRAPDRLEVLGTAPNPARNQATVRLAVPDPTAADDVTLALYDVMGRRVQTVTGVRSGRSAVDLDVSDLSSGVYVLRLTAGGTTRTQRLTVVQ